MRPHQNPQTSHQASHRSSLNVVRSLEVTPFDSYYIALQPGDADNHASQLPISRTIIHHAPAIPSIAYDPTVHRVEGREVASGYSLLGQVRHGMHAISPPAMLQQGLANQSQTYHVQQKQ